jgi:maltose/moltooligosaccharide transporter
MGIFNIFITLPQIVNGVFSGPMVKHLFNSQAVYALLISGAFMLIAAVSVLFVQDQYQKKQ